MESKKLYIIIGSLVLVILALFLIRFFIGRNPPKEGPAAFSCQEQIAYQGYTYNTVKIGEQCWMAENLRAASYRDGTPIPNLTASTEWAEDKQGAFVCYYYQQVNCDNYGALYNWYAVSNEKELCPGGWS